MVTNYETKELQYHYCESASKNSLQVLFA